MRVRTFTRWWPISLSVIGSMLRQRRSQSYMERLQRRLLQDYTYERVMSWISDASTSVYCRELTLTDRESSTVQWSTVMWSRLLAAVVISEWTPPWATRLTKQQMHLSRIYLQWSLEMLWLNSIEDCPNLPDYGCRCTTNYLSRRHKRLKRR